MREPRATSRRGRIIDAAFAVAFFGAITLVAFGVLAWWLALLSALAFLVLSMVLIAVHAISSGYLKGLRGTLDSPGLEAARDQLLAAYPRRRDRLRLYASLLRRR